MCTLEYLEHAQNRDCQLYKRGHPTKAVLVMKLGFRMRQTSLLRKTRNATEAEEPKSFLKLDSSIVPLNTIGARDYYTAAHSLQMVLEKKYLSVLLLASEKKSFM